jgi:hypothetical protein
MPISWDNNVKPREDIPSEDHDDHPARFAGRRCRLGLCDRRSRPQAGLRTAVSGYCLSSCSRMFLGGVARQFTDEQQVGKTRVGFHGNYKSDGRLMVEAMPRLRAWIIAHSDGKADPTLVERWTSIPNHEGFIYFFDAARLNRKDGVSVFICTGNENPANRYNECEKLPGRSGYDLGIFTSTALVKVNQ